LPCSRKQFGDGLIRLSQAFVATSERIFRLDQSLAQLVAFGLVTLDFEAVKVMLSIVPEYGMNLAHASTCRPHQTGLLQS
jgi:hypothetical protein